MTQVQELREYREEVPIYKTKKNGKKRSAMFAVLIVAIIALALLAWHWWNVARFIVTTDDAYTAADSVIISPRVSGYVAQVPVSENQHVQRGDALIVIDDTDYRFKVDQAKAALQAKQAAIAKLARQIELQQLMIAQTKSALTAAQAYEYRAQTIYRRDLALIDKGFVSRDKFDADQAELSALSADVEKARAASLAAESQANVLRAQQDSEQAEVQSAQAVLSSARFDHAQTTITAPMAGVIGNRNVQIGEYVNPGKHLFALVPTEQPYIVANFKETQLERIREGQTVSFVLDAYPNTEGHGVVQSFAPATGAEFALLPPQNATGNFTKIVQRIPVKIRLLDFDAMRDRLRPGLSASVSIDTHINNGDKPQ